jgi:AP endonuclease-2
MKSSRQILPKQVAVPASFDSFFSFPTKKNGYSGIAVYTRRSAVVPLKAEEGLSGLVQPRPPLSDEERISSPSSYPAESPGDDDLDYKDLDSEGRAVVVDLGLFVLISVYCPNDSTGTEEREKFKMDYHRMLAARVQTLIQEGREVMVVGDLNACPAVEDHCEGRIIIERGWAEGLEGEEGFWRNEYRRWLRDWLIRDNVAGGCVVDIVRKFWPERRGMYTCMLFFFFQLVLLR